MAKSLSEMSLTELWELFPIFLVAPRPEWAQYYADMETELKTLLTGKQIARISHVGSTAIAGIWAKNIVDVMVELEADERVRTIAAILQNAGFLIMWEEETGATLNMGYTPEGFADRVYHIHLRRAGDNDELYFRDYLNDHPETAKAYQQLKLGLWKQYEHNRNAYTNAKTDFIRSVTEKAHALYGARYTPASKGSCTLETPRTNLCLCTDARMEELLAMQTDAEMQQAYGEMLSGAREHPSLRQWYAVWEIVRKDGRFIGDLCFKGLSSEGVVEIGYGMLPAYEGRGYATEATVALTVWAAAQPGVTRVEAETDPDNAASQRVLKKAGYIATGTLGEEGPRFVYAGKECAT